MKKDLSDEAKKYIKKLIIQANEKDSIIEKEGYFIDDNVRICHNEERKGYRPITVVFDYNQNKFDQYFRLVGWVVIHSVLAFKCCRMCRLKQWWNLSIKIRGGESFY